MRDLAVITGGANGIGLAVAKACLVRNIAVILLDKDLDALEKSKAQLGKDVSIYCLDITDTSKLLNIMNDIETNIGIPNYIFNNVGIGGSSKPVWEQEEKEIMNALEINFLSAFNLTKALLPKMLAQDRKSYIVNNASLASFYTAPLISPYVISKHSMMAFTECLYHDLKMLNKNVQVAVVCPGGVNTNILDTHIDKQLKELNSEQMHFLIKFAKLIKKGMEPENVAELIFSGLEHNQFYIFTHPEMINIVEDRLRSVIKQQEPQQLDI